MLIRTTVIRDILHALQLYEGRLPPARRPDMPMTEIFAARPVAEGVKRPAMIENMPALGRLYSA